MKAEETIERTLVLIKPDAFSKGFTGPILCRFSEAGLKIVGLKLVARAKKEQLDRHFPISNQEWVIGLGNITLECYGKLGRDPAEVFGTADALEVGKIILEWNYRFLLSGPFIAVVLEGPRAIAAARKLIGRTVPSEAAPGTIRGDFSSDSVDCANSSGRALENVVHASGNPEEAENETSVWFEAGELVD